MKIVKAVKSTEELVIRGRELHGEKYDYSLAEFKTMQSDKIEIICRKGHPNFFQTPYSHLSGSGCIKCYFETRTPKPMLTQEKYIAECEKEHAGYYRYDKTVYNGGRNSVIVTCPLHGDFSIGAFSHRGGTGCSICGHRRGGDLNRLGIEKSIEDSNAAHDFRYDYSLVTEYTTSKALVPIICKEHGVFQQSFAAHRLGQGCPKCAHYGYNRSRPGAFYILASPTLLKVGITSRATATRVKEINKESGEVFVVQADFRFKDGCIPIAIESACLEHLSSKYEKTIKVFNGSTECFKDVDLQDLLQFVSPLINSHDKMALQQ